MNHTHTRHMQETTIPQEGIALAGMFGVAPPAKTWRSRDYFAQLYIDRNGFTRLSVNRVERDKRKGDWKDGITWDELQRVKQETVGDVWAVEVYPPSGQLVDVHNIRHLWILNGRPPYAWHGAEDGE